MHPSFLLARENVRVNTVDGDLRAAKPQHGGTELRLDGRRQRKEAHPTHRVSALVQPLVLCKSSCQELKDCNNKSGCASRGGRGRSRADPRGPYPLLKTLRRGPPPFVQRLAFLGTWGSQVPGGDSQLVGSRLTTLPRPIRGAKFDGSSIPHILPDGQPRTPSGGGDTMARLKVIDS